MPSAIYKQTKCLVHGWINGSRCVACDALHYKQFVAAGLIEPVLLSQGDGPRSDDPSPHEIEEKSLVEREARPPDKWWRQRERIARVITMAPY